MMRIGQRVRIETWGTVEDIADAHGSSYGVALDQRDYSPELSHFRFAWFDANELHIGPALTNEDREALEFAKARVLFNLNASAASEYFSDGYVDRHLHAVAVLDKLLARKP
jgi:hypothetical protein